MKIVLQRVSKASVTVEGHVVGSIQKGALLLLGLHVEDTPNIAEQMAQKVWELRYFEDEQGKMNRSLYDVQASLLVVSQFTLYADCFSGRRPDFKQAAPRQIAQPLYEYFVTLLQHRGCDVQTGRFGAQMEVMLVNEGPVTLVLDSDHLKNESS